MDISDNLERWDQLCEYNIGRNGSDFIDEIEKIDSFNNKSMERIFINLYWYLVEFYLSGGDEKEELITEIEQFISVEKESFSLKSKRDIDFAKANMQTQIFKNLVSSIPVAEIKNFTQLTEIVEKKDKQWKKIFLEREKRVQELEKTLKNQETAFNFVGLYDGFDNLAKAKVVERDGLLYWLRIVGPLIIVAPLIFNGLFIWFLSHFDRVQDIILFTFIPTLSIGAILIYFFRVLLHNYKSVQSQLQQIELRKTLCQFIQSYGEYSSELKSKDKDALSKFENIIFSGIVSDEGKLPSTYDGLDQLMKLFKAGRNTK